MVDRKTILLNIVFYRVIKILAHNRYEGEQKCLGTAQIQYSIAAAVKTIPLVNLHNLSDE